jgi:hypothetical protein
MLMIIPTVGRVVWYFKFASGGGHKGPLAAHVAYVHSTRHVTLMVIDESGEPRPEKSVPLIQDGEPIPDHDYCCWMPYQKAVASGQIPPTIHEQPT